MAGEQFELEDAPPESERRPSETQAVARSPLEIAVRYWPGRWPRVAVLAAFDLERHTEPKTPAEWARVLDTITLLAGSGT